MNGSLAMRSTRLRTLLLVLVGGGMLLSLYLLTSSQYHLKDAKHLLEACQQQKDSLLAQLQVVYEQKNRVEKSLQQEKLDHRKTQDDNQKNNFLRIQVQKAKVEVDTKLSGLQKEQVSLQERYHELESQTKDLREQQIENERKRTKLQADYEQNLRIKDEENTLLHGNLTLALQERDGLETQNVQLNNNIQQLKSDFLNYKRMYIEINQRLKKLSEQKTLLSLPEVHNNNVKESAVANENMGKKDSEPVLPANKLQQENQQMSNDVHVNPDSPQEHSNGLAHGDTPQRSPDQRHPLPAPNIAAKNALVESKSTTQQPPQPPVVGGPIDQGELEAVGAGQQPLAAVMGLKQQLQPPDFGPDPAQHAQHSVDAPPMAASSPGQVVGANQPLLPPPPPPPQQQQDKQEESPQQQQQENFDPQHQEEQNHALQSQEQRDQDTMARKPIVDQNPQSPGLVGQDVRGRDSMFIGGAPQWNPFGVANLGVAPIPGQHNQLRSPEIKAKSNNNNNRPQEEEENYPEDGEDDNAEEQDDNGRDKNVKPFQDHDFEDNEGNDHNQAKEEGIVIAPK